MVIFLPRRVWQCTPVASGGSIVVGNRLCRGSRRIVVLQKGKSKSTVRCLDFTAIDWGSEVDVEVKSALLRTWNSERRGRDRSRLSDDEVIDNSIVGLNVRRRRVVSIRGTAECGGRENQVRVLEANTVCSAVVASDGGSRSTVAV